MFEKIILPFIFINIHDSYNSDKHLEILEELFKNADLLAQKSINKIE